MLTNEKLKDPRAGSNLCHLCEVHVKGGGIVTFCTG